jgi:hypothetical protein
MVDTKEELTVKINELLGLSLVSLDRMTKEDLESLHQAVSKKLEKTQIPVKVLRRPLKEVLDEKVLGKPVGDFSLGEILEAIVGGEEGPLGLGFLPRARNILRSFKEKNSKATA